VLTSMLLLAALGTQSSAQVLGPRWNGHHVDVRSQVIAMDGDCRQIAVDANGISGSGGRLWACYRDYRKAPGLLETAHVKGEVTDTRMTRMGPRWRVVPVVHLPL
jgi:hypothetical protein